MINRSAIDQNFEQVALELGVLTPEQERQVSEAVRNHPQPVPAGGQVAINLGFLDMEVKTAVLMAQSGERMLQALEAAQAPEGDPAAQARLTKYQEPQRFNRLGTVAGEDPALARTQNQWKQAENYALKRRLPGADVTPEKDAAAREFILTNAEQSYRFAAAWMKVRAQEISPQDPAKAALMQKAGMELEVSAQAIFVDARARFSVPAESRPTAEQFEFSVQQYRERERAKAEGKSWVASTGRPPAGPEGGTPGGL